jgi:peptidoglycan/LPS O-acetylase OafA/YrhL
VRNFVGAGYVSVSMFFLLSGYVLARSYGSIHASQRRNFWVARFARVAPAYYTAAAISLAVWTYSFYRGAATFMGHDGNRVDMHQFVGPQRRTLLEFSGRGRLPVSGSSTRSFRSSCPPSRGSAGRN